MIPFIFKRIGSCIIMIFFATLLIFFALDVLPGNAAQTLAGSDATQEVVEALKQELGLDQPAAVRYKNWLTGLMKADMGNSYIYGSPVSELLFERLQVTLPLTLLTILITSCLAIPIGIYTAAHQGSRKDHLITLLSEIGLAIPSFWLGILLVLGFSITLQWFPFGGFPGWNANEGGGVIASLYSLVLPAIALAIIQIAILTRFTRSSIIDEVQKSYVRAVRAKGASPQRTLWRHVLKNASIPILTIIGMQFASLLAGAIVTENVFMLPGLGRLISTSIENRDLIVIRNILLLLVTLVMVVNLIIDCVCKLIDPRHHSFTSLGGV